ncbi:MAG TPA: hypothetical protein VM677_14530, partial [Actinokineospora sp.]|nr:hypothetical protein [Actinokineospora sp.]
MLTGEKRRRWLPLVAVAVLVAPPTSATATPEPPVMPSAADRGPLDVPQAIAEFWAAYRGDGDLRRALAMLDYRVRTAGVGGGESVRRAARILLATHEGRFRRAWGERLRLPNTPSLHQPFVDRAKAESDAAFGTAPTRPRPVTA